MKFPKLQIENFLAITEAEINLADRGLVLIQGVNKADTSAVSNGAGKSSIADALCWCWYGTTARGASGDDVINDKAGKNCRVVSVVEDNGITYTATRHRKHKTGKNALHLKMFDGFKETDLTKGTDKLTQEIANQIIGSSLEVFSGSIYAGQERMPDLPAMTDKQLKTLIEEAAGVTVLEGAYKRAREDMAAVQNDLVTRQGQLTNAQDLLRHAHQTVIDHMASRDTWELGRKTRLTDAKAQIVARVPEVKRVMAELEAMKIAEVDAEIAAIDAKISAVGAEQKKMTELERAVTSAEAAHQTARRDFDSADRLFRAASTAVTNIAHKVGCPCDECGRPLTEKELEAADKAARAKEDAARQQCEAAETAIKTAQEALRAATGARDAFRLSLTDVSAEQARLRILEARRGDYNRLKSENDRRLDALRNLKQKIAEIEVETNPYAPLVAKAEEAKKQAEERLAKVTTEIETVEKKLAVEQEVVKLFGPAGVRARILDEVTPFLNAQTMKYLATMSDGNIEAVWTTLTPAANGSLKEKFSIDVINATGGKKFALISGGEKRKVRIATALALQDLVATRASKPIDLFIGDEIDDALDAAGLERLTTILEEKARERGSVFVISHNEIRDFIRQVMVIEKLPNGDTRITDCAA